MYVYNIILKIYVHFQIGFKLDQHRDSRVSLQVKFQSLA